MPILCMVPDISRYGIWTRLDYDDRSVRVYPADSYRRGRIVSGGIVALVACSFLWKGLPSESTAVSAISAVVGLYVLWIYFKSMKSPEYRTDEPLIIIGDEPQFTMFFHVH